MIKQLGVEKERVERGLRWGNGGATGRQTEIGNWTNDRSVLVTSLAGNLRRKVWPDDAFHGGK